MRPFSTPGTLFCRKCSGFAAKSAERTISMRAPVAANPADPAHGF
jgi:hypothetical protein